MSLFWHLTSMRYVDISEKELDDAILRAVRSELSLQAPDGWWWYTLESNEAIGAEYVQLIHFLGLDEKAAQDGLIRRILKEQREDGAWSLYYGDSGDLNVTIECYLALRLAGYSPESDFMVKARDFILRRGGLTKSRVFTRIHLAMFGLVPWDACPAMPPELILLTSWMPVNIYEFSSWARSCIVPLLVIMNKRPVKEVGFNLDELYAEDKERRSFCFTHSSGFISWENFFVNIDKWLKLLDRIPFRPTKGQAFKACEKWIVEHVTRTEDIYPALAYSAVALHLLGYPLDHPVVRLCLKGLRRFQHMYKGELPPIPHDFREEGKVMEMDDDVFVHQQSCISPVWDTPWSVTALLRAGVPSDHPRLIKAGRWLISKQVLWEHGDWKIKNPHGKGGGWSFEFKNEHFPDIDDTIQVIDALNGLDLPKREKDSAINRGIKWVLSMQNSDGGWAAFDKNNSLELLNKIPFADHGACLDPSSPDMTARVVALLTKFGYGLGDSCIERALAYLLKEQSEFGAWWARWAVNYIFGTSFAIQALARLGFKPDSYQPMKRGVEWLMSIQLPDGGFSESPESYREKRYLPYPASVPSQTAWAILGLIAAGRAASDEVRKGVRFLLDSLREDGTWEERYYTGTGFPIHFYIRYHGYRYFFPLLALAEYRNAVFGFKKIDIADN